MDVKADAARTRRGNGHRAGSAVSETSIPAAEVISTADLRELLAAIQSMKTGDFSVRLPGDRTGMFGKIADAFNDIASDNQRIAVELERVGQAVGREGRTRQRVKFSNRSGAWSEMETSVNTLIDDLLWPTNELTRAVAAVAQGDLLQQVRLDVEGRPLKGEFLRSAKIVNTMIRQLNIFTSEVTRVAREVGTEGKLGGQAQVREVTGVWKELTESVNAMANNLTVQVRNIADVTIAVANGDLSRKSPSTCAARSSSSRKPSTRWWTSCAPSHPR
jgi:methyl-accepting chemotaxis protein